MMFEPEVMVHTRYKKCEFLEFLLMVKLSSTINLFTIKKDLYLKCFVGTSVVGLKK